MKKTALLAFILLSTFIGCKDTGMGLIPDFTIKYQIAYTTGSSKNISVINNDGTKNQIVVSSRMSCKPMDWTSDNKQLIFQKYIYTFDTTDHDTTSLWKVNVDSREEVCLFTKPLAYINKIAVSPFGNKIAFSLTNTLNSSKELHIIDIDGTQDEVLSYDTNIIFPAWLPTGRKLLFTHNNQIYSIKPDKTDLQQLTGEPGDNSNYSISPDGQKIVFNNIVNYKSRVFITDIDGSNCRPITEQYGYMLYNVQWFVNGNYIIFSKYDTTLTRQIFRMDSNGENIKQLTFYDGGQRSYPLCTPDGKIIYYSNNTRDLQIIDINGENKSQLIKLENSYSLFFTISGFIGI